MIKRNSHFSKLIGGYLFPEINRRKQAFIERSPHTSLISLGIGDTTVPLPPHITKSLMHYTESLGTPFGYSGYGPEQGNTILREKIAEIYYENRVSAKDIFISDGSKCDIGRLQTLFGSDVTIAVQDPSYPVYVDTAVIIGQSAACTNNSQYDGIIYLPCTESNQFFPDLKLAKDADIIFITSPNNPTGVAASHKQLNELVDFAQKNRSLIVFDSAYAPFIRDFDFPKSIYEIPGADQVAIEVGSFSKMAGFTGVRLGWTVVPENLKYDTDESIKADWSRLMATFFNGASNVAQNGGIAALDHEGRKQLRGIIDYYMDNAALIKETLNECGLSTYGGEQAPYVWAHFPGRTSWESFQILLEEAHVVTTPGSGFGPCGEEFIRFSAFGHRQDVIEAMKSVKQCLIKNSVTA